MKIGIVTFHNSSNYGAVLQSFALQKVLSDNYPNVEIVDYDNPFLAKGLRKIRFGLSLHSIYYTLVDILHYRSNSTKLNKFIDFFNNHYHLSRKMDKEELIKNGYELDVLVSGSDQIWNPLLNNGFDPIYFGSFPNVKKRVSYASSVGAYDFDNSEYNNQINELLNHYSSIAVREKAKKLSGIIKKDISEVLDPTLLLSEDDWKKEFNLEKSDGNYLLIYALNDFDNVISIASKIAKERQLSIVFLGNHQIKNKDVRVVTDAGPVDFVKYFLDASYVVTNSFHGTAFSINFNKQFASVYNPKSPDRAKTLLDAVGLSSHLIKEGQPNDLDDDEYSKTNKKLLSIRNESTKYLLDAINM